MLSRLTLILTLTIAVMPHAAAEGVLGRAAPAFTLKDAQGQTCSLVQYRGQVVFINFWASWCAPCQVELPELNRLARDYRDRPVAVLAVNVDEDAQAAKAVLKRLSLHRPGFRRLRDQNSRVAARYNLESMPSSFIVDAAGIVRYTHTGFRPSDPGVWRTEIESLLPRRKSRAR